ncbi:hypothetical protein [Arenicella xantha]|uniref:Uncharacterized protein n=1 Tax=Arenicella xantha TaxID=644221 RepID=A0A395JNC4_9GAMM|nr:hypothetical protein [Arenicella xantha]RBP51084.1 hypothetical protein DFR28_102503 [Arenicella xantha]
MGIEFSYRDLKKDMLSHKALALLSEFALIWHANTGELIDLELDDAVIQVLRNSKRSKDRRLRSIYLHLRAEFSNKIESSLTECDGMLADQLMAHITRGRKCHLFDREFVA